MSEKKNVLKLEDITMQFGGVVAVNDLSLEVNEGEIVALIGPNGAGKTTCFNCITGVYEPTNGVVSFNGKVIVANHPSGKMKKAYQGYNGDKYLKIKPVDPTPDEITKLGIARTFQNIRLFSNLTVLDNVIIASGMDATYNLPQAISHSEKYKKREKLLNDKAMNLLEIVGLQDKANERASSLPYGHQRKLEIARAMALDPKLLLLDEPAAGMNADESLELVEFVREIRGHFKITILMIEHHMDVVSNLCDYCTVLNFGKTLAVGTPAEVKSNPEVIRAYLGGNE